MEKNLEILEFDKIKEQIKKYNVNSLSKKKLESLHPLFFYEVIKEELDKTCEAYHLVTIGTMPSLGSLVDLEPYLYRLSKNGTLTLEELYDFVNCLEVIQSLLLFSKEKELENYDLKYFKNYCNKLFFIREVYDNIKYCVTPNYGLYDHASSKLKTIRQNIKKCEEDIKGKLNSFLKTQGSLLSDNYIATRGNHLVLPVKAENRSLVKGIVIDVSDSKNTLFIEPYSVTENNVMLEQLHYEEEIETQRIIRALSDIVNKYNHELTTNNEVLEEISFMYLKGSYGLANDYEIASLSEDNHITLLQAKHPLIDKAKCIANDFFLGGENNNLIVISGPNAGGKTIALKTIALLVILNQCGLPLPVKSASLGVFRDIFVDIGDEQSIEHSLSGFSSHILNVSNIVNKINEHSLIILDELGSRTDPKEGEALAKAIIEYIENSHAIAMITTHYIGIKDFAKESSQITLASMGFDEATLLPSYKLLLNVVGRSYAFEISARLGLKKEIIERAKSFKDTKSNDLDVLIDQMSHKMQEEERILNEIKEKEKEVNKKLLDLNKKDAEFEKKADKLYQEALDKKEEMIEEAYDEINSIVQEFKASNQTGYKPHLKNQAVDKLDKMGHIKHEDEVFDDAIQVGDDVRIKSIGRLAKVTEIKGNKATIVSANTTMKVNLSDVEKAIITKEEKKLIKKVKVSTEKVFKAVPPSLNIVGEHIEEGLIYVRQYIDAAMLARYENVTIIHGHGTGALRKAVQEYLKTNRFVDSFRLGNYNEGGTGATIVTLKKGK